MKKSCLGTALLITVLLLAPSTVFAAVSIDGFLGTPPANWDPTQEWTGNSWGSDMYPTNDSWPDGGENYDIYGLGLQVAGPVNDQKLLVALETGMEANFGEDDSTPHIFGGDILIDFVGSSIDLGGGNVSNSNIDFAIRITDPAYDIYESSLETGTYDTDDFKIFKVLGDGDGYWHDTNDGIPYRVKSSENPLIGYTSEAVYGRYLDRVPDLNLTTGILTSNPRLNAFEMAIDFNLLTAQLDQIDIAGGYEMKVYYRMSCDNDDAMHMIRVPGDGTPGDVVPEPGTFLLFGMGLLGLGALGRRKENEKKE